MSTDAERRETVESFGRVSRTLGTVFRYGVLAATLFGIAMVGVLLMYVAKDAIQPLTADPGWHLVFLVAFVVPTLAVGRYLNRSGDALSVGATALGLPAIGLLFGAGLSAIFIDVLPPLVWFAYYVALALPLAVTGALSRADAEIPFLAWLGASVLAFVLSFRYVPGIVQNVPVMPSDGIVMGLTLGLIVAIPVRSYAASTWEDERTGVVAGGLVLGAALLAPVIATFVPIGVGPVVVAILTVFVGVPTGLYVATVVSHRPGDRVGLLLPAVVVVGALLGAFLTNLFGFAGPESWLDWQFLTGSASRFAEDAGFYPAIVGSILLMFVVVVASFPIGVGAAVYLEEYAPDNHLTRIIKINISNLAGVPSVVYGLLGLGIFITYLGEGIPVLPPAIAGALGREPVYVAGTLFGSGTIVVGGLTLALLILPIVIISAQEAIRAVPDDTRQASYGMGATRWQTVRNVVLPRAFPGILTGTILALGRAIGETAPLLMIGAAAIGGVPQQLDSVVVAMPMQIFAYASTLAGEEFYNGVVPAGVVVIVVTMLAMNSLAIALRNKYQKEG